MKEMMGVLRKSRHRLILAIAVLATVVGVLFYAGCNTGPESASTQPDSIPVNDVSQFGPRFTWAGTLSLEERILYSDAIVRVRFKSVKQVVEAHNVQHSFLRYVGALEFTFEVLEYLKGSGHTEVKAVAFDGDDLYYTRAEAEAADTDFLSNRDTQWDDREAIVFLSNDAEFISSVSAPDRYWLTYMRANGEDGYTVASRWAPVWLPDAASPSGPSGASGAGEQEFLLEAPSASGASGASGQPKTITMSSLKSLIAQMQADVDAGDGSEKYFKCLTYRYSLPRRQGIIKAAREAQGLSYGTQFDRSIESGLPAGTTAFVGGHYLLLREEDKQTKPEGADEWVVTTGRDAHLFDKGWPLIALTARPLPAGEYRFYWAERGSTLASCDALSEIQRTRDEVVLTVTTPAGTVHEAFFDPVALTSGTGTDGTNGVISAAEVTVGSTSTSISGLKWENNQVVLSWSVHTGLDGYALDFIELDGSVGLSLGGSDATADTTAKTLTWSVTEKPWDAGDLLMLRISTATLRVSVVASDATPSENEPVDFNANIVNAPSEGSPSYNWEMNFGGDTWSTVSSNVTLRYLEKPGLRRGVRVTVSYAGGESQTSDPLWVTWE